MLYVILNDGATYTTLPGSVIYDSDTDKTYTIRKRRETKNNKAHETGIWYIKENEREETDNYFQDEDDGVLGK